MLHLSIDYALITFKHVIENNMLHRVIPDCQVFFCRFAEYVNATVSSLHPIHCTRQRRVEVEFDMTTIPAFAVVIIVLWFVLKPKRPKPKIN